jgi:hypothetical protein
VFDNRVVEFDHCNLGPYVLQSELEAITMFFARCYTPKCELYFLFFEYKRLELGGQRDSVVICHSRGPKSLCTR